VIPAYNEESRIVKALVGVIKELQGLDYEIIVSDDGSTDQTVNLIQDVSLDRVVVLRNEHKGPGNAIRRGILHSRGSVVVLSMADIVISRVDIETYLTMLRHYDFLQLSKNLPSSRVEHRSFKRELYSRVFHYLERNLLSLPYRDTGGPKIMRAEIAKELASQALENGFMFNVEMVYIAHNSGKFKLKETYWDVDLEGKYGVRGSRVTTRQGWKLLVNLIRFSREKRRGTSR
jgi:dolichyl-phosphate beta-glucosyltransferase